MKIKKILSSLLAATMLFGSISANAVTIESDDMPKASGAAVEQQNSGFEEIEETVDKTLYGLPENIKDGAILHAWSWSFKTIYDAIPDIAAAGYTAVQTSPASKCYDIGAVHGLDKTDYDYLMGTTRSDIFGTDGNTFNGSGGAWWWYYQPVKLEVGNYALGSQDDYRKMCNRAHKYGVKIITDIVANHTTAHFKVGETQETAHTEIATNPVANTWIVYKDKSNETIYVDTTRGRTGSGTEEDPYVYNDNVDPMYHLHTTELYLSRQHW